MIKDMMDNMMLFIDKVIITVDINQTIDGLTSLGSQPVCDLIDWNLCR